MLCQIKCVASLEKKQKDSWIFKKVFIVIQGKLGGGVRRSGKQLQRNEYFSKLCKK